MKPLRPLFNLALGITLGIGLVIGLLGRQSGVWAATPSPQQHTTVSDCDNSRSVQVTGAATINVVPDRVLIKLGVESRGLTPDQVQAENLAAIQRVTSAVRGLGVAEKDIATDYYLVNPVYGDYESLQIKGYRINNVVAVTLNDVNQAGAVLIAALKAGANEVLDVEFYTSQLRKYRDEARALAMKAATEKAQALAGAGGAQAGCLLKVDENSWSYYTGSWWGGRDRAQWAQNVVQNAATSGSQPSADDTPLSLGQIAIRAEVNASFNLH
jgi:uncharacterized protein